MFVKSIVNVQTANKCSYVSNHHHHHNHNDHDHHEEPQLDPRRNSPKKFEIEILSSCYLIEHMENSSFVNYFTIRP